MSLCRSSVFSAVAVGKGSGRVGLVDVAVAAGGLGVAVAEGGVGVAVAEGGVGSGVEQPEMINDATSRTTALRCFKDMASSWIDSI